MPLREGLHREPLIIVMVGRRGLKPTRGWVVDMRHYLDEETGDLPLAIPERVLGLAVFFGGIVAWVTDHLPEGDEYTNVPCRRSPVVAAVAARSSRTWTARLDTSSRIVRCAGTTDGSMAGKTRRGIAGTTSAWRRRVRRRRPCIERRAGKHHHEPGIHLSGASSSRHAGFVRRRLHTLARAISLPPLSCAR
jgi:hypothetical protein